MRQQKGYVLVFALITTAIMALLVGSSADKISRLRDRAFTLRERAQAIETMYSDRNEMLFRMAALPLTVNGLPAGERFIRLDNREYATGDGGVIRIQDNGGLFNLLSANDARLSLLLRQFKIKEDDLPRYIDVLRDYQEAGKMHRLNGIAKSDYKDFGLPPPRGEPWLTPLELARIPFWRDLLTGPQGASLAARVTTSGPELFNPNTSAREHMLTVPGITPEMADALIERRQLQPIATVYELQQITGQAFDFLASLGASTTQRIQVSSEGLPWWLSCTVTISPEDDHSPWQVHYCLRVPKEIATSNPAKPGAKRPEPLPEMGILPVNDDKAIPPIF